jgi:hypothetical protein
MHIEHKVRREELASVRIDFGFDLKAKKGLSRAIRHLDQQEAIHEVRRALLEWDYMREV